MQRLRRMLPVLTGMKQSCVVSECCMNGNIWSIIISSPLSRQPVTKACVCASHAGNIYSIRNVSSHFTVAFFFFPSIQNQLNEDWQCVEGSCKLFVMIFQQVNHRITHQGNVWVSVAVNISRYFWGILHFYFFTVYFLELIKNWVMSLVYINRLHMYKLYKKNKKKTV